MTSPHLLIVYHTAEGQTAKVAERIAATVAEAGARAEAHLAADAPAPHGYDAVILGDSIHVGRHSEQLTRYLADHAEALALLPTAVFQVSLTSATDDADHSAVAHQMFHDLLEPTGLDPEVVGFFAGALAYTRYGWLKRQLLRHIAASDGRDTDTSRDHEYTDWDAVEHFALDAVAAARYGQDHRRSSVDV